MARVTGKDVLLDLMTTVDDLTQTQHRHEEIIGRIVTRLDLMVEHTNGLADRMDALTTQMNGVTTQMNGVTTQMNGVTTQMNGLTHRIDSMSGRMSDLTTHVREISDDQVALRGEFVELLAINRHTSAGLKRLSELLYRGFASTDERLDHLEGRVAKLEKKTG